MKTLGFLMALLLASATGLRAADPVIVHEWGTFTCLQDEHGNAIGGINVDDEPVPNFVYGSYNGDVISAHGLGAFGLPPYNPFAGKAGPLPTCDPSVTMRLETPVLYIYPPKDQSPKSVPALDVHVDFHGGYLTQFYPYADSTAFTSRNAITSESKSSLTWKGVRLGSSEKPVESSDKVWITPRETSAPLLEVHPMMKDVNGVVHDDAQVEHFLFYRGVGHLDSPLRVWSTSGTSSAEFGPFFIEPYFDKTFSSTGWLTEIHADGSCALAVIPSFHIAEKAAMIPKGCHFESKDFTTENVAKLKASMHEALVKEGLFDDEATAMLKTWELSYFKSPGLRFFYIVPRIWTDKVLPLTVTGAQTEITRVMVGRIELISDEQKAAVARLAEGPCPDLAAFKDAAGKAINASKLPQDQMMAYFRGERPLTDLGFRLGFKIPRGVTDYLSLGRFRDALITHEQSVRPTTALAQFIKDNGLAAGESTYRTITVTNSQTKEP